MPNKPTPAREYLSELCAQFPDAATKTLARKAYAAHPAMWRDLEACRLMLRDIRGNRGNQRRQQTGDKTHFRPNGTPGDPEQFKLPEPLEHFEDWQIRHYDTPGWWLVLSDLHIPYHSVEAITACLTLAKERQIVGVLLNGDVQDHYQLSRFTKDPTMRTFAAELDDVQAFLAELRSQFTNAAIVWKLGNHEERFEAYMRLKAPELLGVKAFEYRSLTGCDKHRVEMIGDMQPVALGKLLTIHGHEYRQSFADPVNPARSLFLRARVSAICGHRHRSSSHSQKDLLDKVITCWSTGCLCNLRPEYMPLNDWNHGAALVELSKDGAFQVENFRVLDGVVYR